MAPEHLNARQLMLDSLSEERAKRNEFVRGCFVVNERVPKSVFSASEPKKLTIIISSALIIHDVWRQLRSDILAACDLFSDAAWEQDILQDSVDLLNYQIYEFLEQRTENLKKIAEEHTKEDIPTSMQTIMFKTFADIPTRLNEAKNNTIEAFTEFLAIFAVKNASADRDPDTVPASSFRELIVRSMASTRAEAIAQATERIRDGQISMEHAHPIMEIMNQLRKHLKSESPAWLARTMAIVAHHEYGVILTGSTRMTTQCVDNGEENTGSGNNTSQYTFLDNVSKNVTNERLGQRFRDVINHCTEEFCIQFEELCSNSRNPIPVEEIHDKYIDYMKKTPSTWRQKLSAMSNAKIYCWAFDSINFSLKPPCIRCQCLYDAWSLAERSTQVRGGTIEQRSHLGQYQPKKFPCTYCAETVAAAKVFLLRYGTLVLI